MVFAMWLMVTTTKPAALTPVNISQRLSQGACHPSKSLCPSSRWCQLVWLWSFSCCLCLLMSGISLVFYCACNKVEVLIDVATFFCWCGMRKCNKQTIEAWASLHVQSHSFSPSYISCCPTLTNDCCSSKAILQCCHQWCCVNAALIIQHPVTFQPAHSPCLFLCDPPVLPKNQHAPVASSEPQFQICVIDGSKMLQLEEDKTCHR